MAYELICQYLNDELSLELRKELRLPEDMSDSTVSKTQIKRKANESESCATTVPSVDYSAYNLGTNGTNTSAPDNKRSKMSRTQRELMKVDKTGMKSISSFFKPKPK